MNKDNTKPKNVNFHQVPGRLWRKLKKHIPKPAQGIKSGRPRVNNRDVINGIWYVLWTGCQWKAVKREWFQVSSSVLHERFQTWKEAGVFDKLFTILVKFYAQERKIGWKWQSADSKSCAAPLGGEQTGKNPTDRGKLGSKIHLLVDQYGAPLAIYISGANQHDKWSVDDLVVSIVVKRPYQEQHFCGDKGYDYDDVHEIIHLAGYMDHIKHRRRRNEPKEEECPLPGEHSFPARRWVVERTLSWLVRRRSLRTRWCKKPSNWMAFVKLACAHILLDLALFG